MLRNDTGDETMLGAGFRSTSKLALRCTLLGEHQDSRASYDLVVVCMNIL